MNATTLITAKDLQLPKAKLPKTVLMKIAVSLPLILVALLAGWVNPATAFMLVTVLGVMSYRQVEVAQEDVRKLEGAFVQRGLHFPLTPSRRWQAEAMIDAIEQYDLAKKR